MGTHVSRWLAWTGPLFTVLFFVAILALEGSTPGEQASAQRVMDYYNSHQTRTLISVFLAPVAAALLLLFVSYLRSLARERSISVGPGPTVLVGGGILWASGLLLGSVFELTLVSTSDHGQAQIAQTANVLSNDAWIPFIAGIAITMIGAGMTVLGSNILPHWLGWVALAVGVVSLIGPGGFAGFFLAPLWLLVAGVLAFMSSTAPADTLTESRSVSKHQAEW
jgi:hypothetical protein